MSGPSRFLYLKRLQALRDLRALRELRGLRALRELQAATCSLDAQSQTAVTDTSCVDAGDLYEGPWKHGKANKKVSKHTKKKSLGRGKAYFDKLAQDREDTCDDIDLALESAGGAEDEKRRAQAVTIFSHSQTAIGICRRSLAFIVLVVLPSMWLGAIAASHVPDFSDYIDPSALFASSAAAASPWMPAPPPLSPPSLPPLSPPPSSRPLCPSPMPPMPPMPLSPPPPCPQPPPQPPQCTRADLSQLYALDQSESCGSSTSRMEQPASCNSVYMLLENLEAVRCVHRDGRQGSKCNDQFCRDINHDCCTVGTEVAKCSNGEGGAKLHVKFKGAGYFLFQGGQLPCANMYTCCYEEPTGCFPSEESLPCHPLPPPDPPAVPPASPPPPSPADPPWEFMSAERCEALWADPSSRFHQLWGDQGWRIRRLPDGPACWGYDAMMFFDNAWWGRDCWRNWYTGNTGSFGSPFLGGPSNSSNDWHFTNYAPALLGFDEAIEDYCAEHGGGALTFADGDMYPYNTCRNVEWQVCAAKGDLPGQSWSKTIKFAKAPHTLSMAGTSGPALGSCTGYHPAGCKEGFASSDIFFLEVCFYSMMCSNREELFTLGRGTDWTCDMDYEGFVRMRDYVVSASRRRLTLKSVSSAGSGTNTSKTLKEVTRGHLRQES